MKMNKLTVALVQHQAHSNPTENLAYSTTQIAQCAQQGAELIVLAELHQHRYFCQEQNPDNFDLAETIPGPSTEYFSALAQQHQCVIVASLFEQEQIGLYYNTAVVFDKDGSIAGKYRKTHIPDDPGYNEKYYFKPGNLGLKPIKSSLGKLGILICWDQWFPEAARMMALAGAEILVYPTAIGWEPQDNQQEQQRQLQAWQTIQRGHAIANALPVISCNRTGFEPAETTNLSGINFWGNSFICGAQGEFIAQANANAAENLIAEIDCSATKTQRHTWPLLRDRRIDIYG